MDFVNNLPVILAALTAFLAGLYGYMSKIPNIRIYQNMCLFLICFYIIGTLLKRTIKSVWDDYTVKTAQSAEAAETLSGSINENDEISADPDTAYAENADNSATLNETGGESGAPTAPTEPESEEADYGNGGQLENEYQ